MRSYTSPSVLSQTNGRGHPHAGSHIRRGLCVPASISNDGDDPAFSQLASAARRARALFHNKVDFGVTSAYGPCIADPSRPPEGIA